MEIVVDRKYRNVKNGNRIYTVSNLYIDGEWFCNTIEDKDWGWTKDTPVSEIYRIKKNNSGKTAIPKGTYQVTIDVVSPKYGGVAFYKTAANGGRVPRLIGVPGFDGILIHAGNTEADSAGCLIVGMNKQKGKVLNSRTTFSALYKKLKSAEGGITIKIL